MKYLPGIPSQESFMEMLIKNLNSLLPVVIFVVIFYLVYHSRSKLVLGQLNNYFLMTPHSTKYFQVDE